jgi:hypothetical protein
VVIVASESLDDIATWTPPADLFDVAVEPGAVTLWDGLTLELWSMLLTGSTGCERLSDHPASTEDRR